MPETRAEGHSWRAGQNVWRTCGRTTTRAKAFSWLHLYSCKVATDRQKLCCFYIREMSTGDLFWQHNGRATAGRILFTRACLLACPAVAQSPIDSKSENVRKCNETVNPTSSALTSFTNERQHFVAVSVFHSVISEHSALVFLLPVAEDPSHPVHVVVELELWDELSKVPLSMLRVSGPRQTSVGRLQNQPMRMRQWEWNNETMRIWQWESPCFSFKVKHQLTS